MGIQFCWLAEIFPLLQDARGWHSDPLESIITEKKKLLVAAKTYGTCGTLSGMVPKA